MFDPQQGMVSSVLIGYVVKGVVEPSGISAALEAVEALLQRDGGRNPHPTLPLTALNT